MYSVGITQRLLELDGNTAVDDAAKTDWIAAVANGQARKIDDPDGESVFSIGSKDTMTLLFRPARLKISCQLIFLLKVDNTMFAHSLREELICDLFSPQVLFLASPRVW